MLWFIYALGSSFTFALVSVLDKLIIVKHMPNPRVFIVLVGLLQFVIAAVVLPFSSPTESDVTPIVVAVAAGLASGLYLVIMFWVMGSQEVSRIVPVVSTYPVFVALMAQVVLGEYLSVAAWLSILVTVIGAAIVSLGPSGHNSQNKAGISTFAILFIASLGFGMSQFLVKVLADDMSVWTQLYWRSLGAGVACFALLAIPGTTSQVMKTLLKPRAVGLTIIAEFALVFVGLLFLMLSIYSGPVSLATTVMASRSLFVFALSIILSLRYFHILDEPMEKGVMTSKFGGTAMTVAGVTAITLL